MKNPVLRILPALIFAGVALIALIQNRDYVEAGIWGAFAMAVLLPATSTSPEKKRVLQKVATGFLLLGILLLVLRLLHILPVPVRPLP